jgi:hypothetical protein
MSSPCFFQRSPPRIRVIRTVATSILRDPATDALPKRIAETLAKGRELVKVSGSAQ